MQVGRSLQPVWPSSLDRVSNSAFVMPIRYAVLAVWAGEDLLSGHALVVAARALVTPNVGLN